GPTVFFFFAVLTATPPPSAAAAAPLSSAPGTRTFVPQPGHLIALPRAASGAFSDFSQLGQRTLTGIMAFERGRSGKPDVGPALRPRSARSFQCTNFATGVTRERRGASARGSDNVAVDYSSSVAFFRSR